ncbi:MAG TPA: aminotransferase class I/II-fold pyridoxal phosphate-dependent enzyme [Gemmatimonadaceae bacterium]|nr:aminotransferase class I/II-fold pyridoxal phosphate-dependent enzyme [Gemmatimonadaceae bacterium]
MTLHAIPEFALERYFARWEFAVRHVMCASDVEAMALQELLALADPETRGWWEGLTLGYTDSTGLPALRAEIGSLYDAVSPDEVLTFSGAEEAIFVAMHALLTPGDHAVVVVPGYQSLHSVARAAGADVTAIPLREETGWALDLDAVRAAVNPRTRAIVVNYPHSPTGALLSRRELLSLVALAERQGAWLFSDEVYRGLELDPSTRLPAAVDLSPRAVSLGVMSKAYGLAGLRVGWIATRDQALRARLAALKDYTTICNAAPSELLALIALRARTQLVARSMTLIRDNLARFDAFVGRQGDRLAWVPPRAGSVAFPRLLHEDADAVAEALVREHGVLLLPGSLFGVRGGHFRVGFGRRDFPEALARLDAFLATHPHAGSPSNSTREALLP